MTKKEKLFQLKNQYNFLVRLLQDPNFTKTFEPAKKLDIISELLDEAKATLKEIISLNNEVSNEQIR